MRSSQCGEAITLSTSVCEPSFGDADTLVNGVNELFRKFTVLRSSLPGCASVLMTGQQASRRLVASVQARQDRVPMFLERAWALRWWPFGADCCILIQCSTRASTNHCIPRSSCCRRALPVACESQPKSLLHASSSESSEGRRKWQVPGSKRRVCAGNTLARLRLLPQRNASDHGR